MPSHFGAAKGEVRRCTDGEGRVWSKGKGAEWLTGRPVPLQPLYARIGVDARAPAAHAKHLSSGARSRVRS